MDFEIKHLMSTHSLYPSCGAIIMTNALYLQAVSLDMGVVCPGPRPPRGSELPLVVGHLAATTVFKLGCQGPAEIINLGETKNILAYRLKK
ncbi:hypothetical protein J6590_057418 [Homalodisca vitripennis]|nr:hypothetical protein J6590_057418 [Homalodisca vitripennis]